MEAILGAIDPGIILALCGLLCCGGLLVGILLPILGFFGDILGLFGVVFEAFFDILSGGPLAWCGCFLVLFGCFICFGIVVTLVSVLSTCGTPDAVNFCRLF